MLELPNVRIIDKQSGFHLFIDEKEITGVRAYEVKNSIDSAPVLKLEVEVADLEVSLDC